ncbi:MAG: hypothetical protein AAB656_02630 [Patescibacteria group bacterium]
MTAKLDKNGIILPLAIGAIVVIAFVVLLYRDSVFKIAEKLPEIKTAEELTQVLSDLDGQDPSEMNTDVNGVVTDASGL